MSGGVSAPVSISEYLPPMRTNKNTIPSVEFRIDPLGIDRLRWLKSFFEATGEKPSNSVIIRRALTVYLEHVEKAMHNEEKTSLEVVRLKAHTDGDRSPWNASPVFDGRPFSKMLREQSRKRSARAIRRAFGIELPTQITNHD